MEKSTAVNPLENLRALVMLFVQRSANGNPGGEDVVSLMELIQPLPQRTQEIILKQVRAFLHAHRNVRILGRKDCNTTLNRRLIRMERTLAAAERNAERHLEKSL